jgi:SAM-dependent methyltransferase
VETCGRRFPGVKFVQGDARDLSRFGSRSKFLVMFSLNGICMVDHVGRMEILREIHRVLMPGGVILFSSYNVDSDNYEAFFRFPRFFMTWNPARLGLRGARWVKDTGVRAVNRMRFAKLERRGEEYSIINDACHNYGVMLYYTSLAKHVEQLESVGFERIEAYDQSGRRIETNTRDDSMMFLARKRK